MTENQSTEPDPGSDDTDPASRIRGNTPQAEDGRFEDKYDDSEILSTLADAFPEPLSNVEIADRCGFSRATAHNRLKALLDEVPGLHTKKIGARARIWWIAPETAQDRAG